MRIHITEKCIENHGVENRIEWALEKLREYMKNQINEGTQTTFEITANFLID
jgi:hypothetical protein